jgi:hypothetical protein
VYFCDILQALIGEIIDPNMTFIPPVNIFHPERDVIATGASGK